VWDEKAISGGCGRPTLSLRPTAAGWKVFHGFHHEATRGCTGSDCLPSPQRGVNFGSIAEQRPWWHSRSSGARKFEREWEGAQTMERAAGCSKRQVEG